MPSTGVLDRLLPLFAGAYGPPGRESGIRDAIVRAVRGVGKRETDAMGNLHVHVPGRGPRLLLAAHMDAPGVIVTRVEASGQARLTLLGGPGAPDLIGASVALEDGTPGLLGCDRTKSAAEIDADALALHTGLPTKDAKKRLAVGAVAALDGGLTRLGAHWCGATLDNRAGCAAVAAAVLHRTRGMRYDLHVVFTVQSDLGARGAATGAFGIEPDLAVVVDVAAAGEGPGSIVPGEGPAVALKELGYLAHPAAFDWVRRAARAERVKLQWLIRDDAGSDARAIRASRGGVPTAVIAIPARRVGGPRVLVHEKDLTQTVALLTRLLRTPETDTRGAR
jgi:endoglucanase